MLPIYQNSKQEKKRPVWLTQYALNILAYICMARYLSPN